MRVHSLGHVVIKVRDQQRAEAFYGGLLGIPIAARLAAWSMTFFTLGNHHDFAIAAVGDDADAAPEKSPGLLHVAFKIGEQHGRVAAGKGRAGAAGVAVEAYDHGVTQSIYFSDPDGNMVECYVDTSDAWKHDPSAVAQVVPLEL